jgi:hypothetical protein
LADDKKELILWKNAAELFKIDVSKLRWCHELIKTAYIKNPNDR